MPNDKKKKNVSLGPYAPSVNPINPGNIQKQREIPRPNAKHGISKFAFSLEFFRQIDFFQIGQQQQSWYISLINRLQQLSTKNREVFMKDIVEKNNYRYHEINWNSTNVPIKKADLNWIEKDYLENDDEFPFVQFHVSLALGRVVGFWDENNVFQIVLLDPLHNIQPSKRYSYKVDDTHFMSSEISSLLVDLQKIKGKIKTETSCSICREIISVPSKNNNTNLLIAHLEDHYIEELDKVNISIEEVIQLGILSIDKK